MKDFIKTVVSLTLVVVATLAVKIYVFTPVVVDGDSMFPTLQDRDVMILNKLEYRLSDVERFEIVVVLEEGEYLVKRVVGLPGETLEYSNNELIIDGEVIAEPYLDSGVETYDFGASTLADNEYFVVGDNRAYSRDSRLFGPITEDQIIGHTSQIVYPFDRFKNVE
jgi:signal peptidase I